MKNSYKITVIGVVITQSVKGGKEKVAEEWSVLLSAFRPDVFPAQTVGLQT